LLLFVCHLVLGFSWGCKRTFFKNFVSTLINMKRYSNSTRTDFS
jgi:hypothetical protein